MKNFGQLVHHCILGSVAALAALMSPYPARAADAPPAVDSPTSQRLNPSQYRQTIMDVFGSSIVINGRFEPELRDSGLLAIGSRRATFSDAGIERYDDLARGIAAQVVDERHRDVLIPCKPRSATASDDACARAFLSAAGRMLYRRPLPEEEIQSFVDVARSASTSTGDFYSGLATSLADMLISPKFLFRYKQAEPDPAHPGLTRLDAYSKAATLSYFLWNTTPDEPLLESAASGELQTERGLKRQVARMVSSPALEAGVRAFFSDMLNFDQFEVLSKDSTFFPKFTVSARDEAQEQTLRTIVDQLIVRQGDYRDLLTTPHTFLTRSLAALYGVPLPETSDNGQPMHWQPYTYAVGDPRAGILAQASFVALNSPSGRTSPTGRGKAFRENLLCQPVPPPPANVDFKFVEDTQNPAYRTARARLTAHRTNPVCAGCHKITDPIGLALENFDSAGSYRTTERGAPIDTSGDWKGVKFDGPVGFIKLVHDDPALTNCVAQRTYAFGAGHLPKADDAEWNVIQKKFTDSHYNFVELLRQIALSDLLYRVAPTQMAAVGNPVEGGKRGQENREFAR